MGRAILIYVLVALFLVSPGLILNVCSLTLPDDGLNHVAVLWPSMVSYDDFGESEYLAAILNVLNGIEGIPFGLKYDLINISSPIDTVEALIGLQGPFNSSLITEAMAADTPWTSRIIPPLPTNLRYTTQYKAIIGSSSSELSEVVGYGAAYYEIIHFLPSSVPVSFSDTNVFPWSFQTLTNDDGIASAAIAFATSMGWKNLVYIGDETNEAFEFSETLMGKLPADWTMTTYSINLDGADSEDEEDDLIDTYLQLIQKSQVRVIYLNHPSAVDILERAQLMSLAGTDTGVTWIGYEWCSDVFDTVEGTDDEALLVGAVCFQPHEPLESTEWTNTPYYMVQVDPTLDNSLSPEFVGFTNAIEGCKIAFYDLQILNIASIKDASVIRWLMGQLVAIQGLYSTVVHDSRGDTFVNLDFLNYRMTPFGGSYLEIVGTYFINSSTLSLLDDIYWSNGLSGIENVPDDQFYALKDGQEIKMTINWIYWAIFFVSTIIATYASQIAITSAIRLRLQYLQKLQTPSMLWKLKLLAPWVFIATFEASVVGTTTFYLAIFVFRDDSLKRYLNSGDIAISILAPFGANLIYQIIVVILASQDRYEEIKEDIELQLQLNGNKEHSVDSNNITTNEKSTSSSANTRAASRRAARKLRNMQASRNVVERLVDDLIGIYEHTTILSLCASFAATISMISCVYFIIGSVRLPNNLFFKIDDAAYVGIVGWVCAHYYVTKVIYYSHQTFWLLVYPLVYSLAVFLTFLTHRVYAIYATWNRAKQSVNFDVSENISDTNAMIAAFALLALSLFVFIGLLMDRLQLSRNTLDMLLNNAQDALQDMEKTLNQEKESKDLATKRLTQKRKLLEMLLSCRPLYRDYGIAFALAPEEVDHKAKPRNIRKSSAPDADPASCPPTKGDTFLADALAELQTNLGTLQLERGNLFTYKSEVRASRLLEDIHVNIDLSAPVLHTVVHSIQIEHILLHPVCFEIFKDYLNKIQNKGTDRSIEIAVFWLDIQRFRGLTDATLRSKIAQEMYDTFLSPSAVYSIPISLALKNEVRHELQNGTNSNSVSATLFNSVQTAVTTHLRLAYEHFITSIQFKVCALTLGHPAYTKGSIAGVGVGPSTNPSSIKRGRESNALFTTRGKPSSINKQPSSATTNRSSITESKHHQQLSAPDDPSDIGMLTFTPRNADDLSSGLDGQLLPGSMLPSPAESPNNASVHPHRLSIVGGPLLPVLREESVSNADHEDEALLVNGNASESHQSKSTNESAGTIESNISRQHSS